MKGLGRWILVTYSLPLRSKNQRAAARHFLTGLLNLGYTQIHAGTVEKYLPVGRDPAREMRKMLAISPPRGTVTIVEVTESAHRRSDRRRDGVALTPPAKPELLTVL